MSKTKETTLHINSILPSIKNQIKRFAKEDDRSLEKEVVYILKDYIERRKGIITNDN
jgi:hypothetical protein